MQPKKIWANLAVAEIAKTRKFYPQIGFKLNDDMSSDELTSFSIGENNFVINFFTKERLQSDGGMEVVDLKIGNEILFSLSADSKKEVDKWMEEIKNAGGTISFDPQNDHNAMYEENNYYVCVFADPDGHKFNIFYSPNM